MTAKILIVEDDGISSSALRVKLETWGYETPIALTGKEAIKQFQNTDPDLVIMDIGLKGELNGIETADLIDAEFKTPIIYYSAKNYEEISERVENLKNRDYLSKTCRYEDLKLSIEKSLKKTDLNSNKNKLTSNKDNEMLSEVLNSQNQNIGTTHGDETLNETESTKEKDLIVKRAENFQNQNYIKIKSMAKNSNPLIENSKKEDFNGDYINSVANNDNNSEIIVSKKISDEYNKTQQKIAYELQNLEKNFFKVSDKVVSQEIEIEALNKTKQEYIDSICKRDKKIEEMGKHQQKLEEKIGIYKKQNQKMLNEMDRLKKQITTFISTLNE